MSFFVGPASAAQGGGSLVAASDWGTATGTSLNAYSDGGFWDSTDNPNNLLNVVSASGFDFPAGMSNVLRIAHPDDDNQYGVVAIENGWTLPSIGNSLYCRLYFRHDIAGSGGGTFHPVQAAFEGGAQCPFVSEFMLDKTGASTFGFDIASYFPANEHDWLYGNLNKNATYRYEERYERTATNSWKLHCRLYNSSNVQIAGNSDFVCTGWHANHTLTTYAGTITSYTDCLRHKMICNPGAGGGRGSNDAAHQFIYWGGFAVSLTDWCGAYVPGEGP
jgi:hypothetical protein